MYKFCAAVSTDFAEIRDVEIFGTAGATAGHPCLRSVINHGLLKRWHHALAMEHIEARNGRSGPCTKDIFVLEFTVDPMIVRLIRCAPWLCCEQIFCSEYHVLQSLAGRNRAAL